jgi:hypothetical protein
MIFLNRSISEAPLYIDDSPNLTMMEIRAKARRLHQKDCWPAVFGIHRSRVPDGHARDWTRWLPGVGSGRGKPLQPIAPRNILAGPTTATAATEWP